MDALIVEYRNEAGTYIVRIDDNKYYYGNGNDINGFGISANQFLRFNPYMEYVEPKNLPVPDDIKEWIAANGGL